MVFTRVSILLRIVKQIIFPLCVIYHLQAIESPPIPIMIHHIARLSPLFSLPFFPQEPASERYINPTRFDLFQTNISIFLPEQSYPAQRV